MRYPKQVGENAEELQADLETIALLDSIFARASWGVKNNACRRRTE